MDVRTRNGICGPYLKMKKIKIHKWNNIILLRYNFIFITAQLYLKFYIRDGCLKIITANLTKNKLYIRNLYIRKTEIILSIRESLDAERELIEKTPNAKLDYILELYR